MAARAVHAWRDAAVAGARCVPHTRRLHSLSLAARSAAVSGTDGAVASGRGAASTPASRSSMMRSGGGAAALTLLPPPGYCAVARACCGSAVRLAPSVHFAAARTFAAAAGAAETDADADTDDGASGADDGSDSDAPPEFADYGALPPNLEVDDMDLLFPEDTCALPCCRDAVVELALPGAIGVCSATLSCVLLLLVAHTC